VPLSDYERRVLDEIEQNLIMDDPRFVASISPRISRIPPLAWATSVLVGLGFVVLGLIAAGGVGVTFAVVGFMLIVGSSWAAVRACRDRRSETPGPAGR
jgi:hypothetical protein